MPLFTQGHLAPRGYKFGSWYLVNMKEQYLRYILTPVIRSEYYFLLEQDALEKNWSIGTTNPTGWVSCATVLG